MRQLNKAGNTASKVAELKAIAEYQHNSPGYPQPTHTQTGVTITRRLSRRLSSPASTAVDVINKKPSIRKRSNSDKSYLRLRNKPTHEDNSTWDAVRPPCKQGTVKHTTQGPHTTSNDDSASSDSWSDDYGTPKCTLYNDQEAPSAGYMQRRGTPRSCQQYMDRTVPTNSLFPNREKEKANNNNIKH